MKSTGLDALKAALPKGAWTQDPDLIDPHLREWRDKYFGATPILLTPRTTEEVAAAVKICAAHKLPLMPQGGNTGLVGGCLLYTSPSPRDLSTSRMPSSA